MNDKSHELAKQITGFYPPELTTEPLIDIAAQRITAHTAAAVAEAFLRTIGKWEETP